MSSNKFFFYPLTVSINKCGGYCNSINDPYAQVFVPNKVKNMNMNVFHLILEINETRFLVQHESCEF